MKRYKISVFGGDEQSSVEMDLRPTEVKVVERVSALLLARLEGFDNAQWMDIEEVKERAGTHLLSTAKRKPYSTHYLLNRWLWTVMAGHGKKVAYH